jgi:antitoxin (DNA-binding transcriptional repressor) of toxin-antitoxin stability system
MWHVTWHNRVMPSVNIRQLRDTRRLKELLSAGQTVELRERQNVIARIVPAQLQSGLEDWPDFDRRRRKIFGKRLVSGAELVIEERGRF